MISKNQIEIERKKELLERAKFSRSTLHEKIKKKEWVPPIPLGARAVGFLKHENDQLLAALVNGIKLDDLKALVSKLIAERKNLLEVSQ